MKKLTTVNSLPAINRTVVLMSVLASQLALSGLAQSQSINPDAVFADDFSIDSIRYSAQSFSEVPGSGTARVSQSAIALSAQQGSYPSYGNIYVSLPAATDTLLVSASLSSATSLPTGTRNESAVLAVEQRIYNTIADGGHGDFSGVGDVQARFDVRLRGDGTTEHIFCIGEQTVDNFEPVNLFNEGTNSCLVFDDVTIQSDIDYTFGFVVDRVAKSLTVVFDDKSRTVDIPGPMFMAEGPNTGFQLIHEDGQGAGGSALANVRSVTTDGGTDTITAGHSIGRYRQFDRADNRSAELVDEQLRLTSTANENGGAGIQIRVSEPTDYLEAVVQVSGTTQLGESGRHYAELRGDLFNDTADNGFNGSEGDVSAFITFAQDVRGLRRIEYCLRRSNDANDDERTGLLDDGRRCMTAPIRLELDVPYRIALALDRDRSTVTFRVNGFTHVQTIATGIFAAARKSMEIGNYADDLATTVLLVDDLRTSPEALTISEQASSLTMTPAFPSPIDPASLVADSAFSVPVFDADQPLDFIDDFSTPTMRYGFWDGRERGEVAVSGSASEGYVEFQVRAASTDDSNYAEFYLDGPTDSVSAVVSLSSDSALPVDSDAEAAVRLQGTFYNDTADGGTDQRLGDVFVSFNIRLRGDGRRAADLYMERRAADGSRDQRLDYQDFLGSAEDVLRNIVIELDTLYTLELSVDRTANTLTAKLDDVEQILSIPTNMFTPARSDKQVQIAHRGASGRAVGRIHSITTDKSTTDFSSEFPLLGPYRPAFNDGYPGIDVEYQDSRVRMVVDSALTDGRGADLQARGASEYLGATMMMSAETQQREGDAFVGIGGLFYNDTADGGTDGATGSVFASLTLAMRDDRDGTPIMVGEYCAFRSQDSNFGESVELIGGDTEFCPRFAMPVMTEVAYDMSIELDKERNVLVYTLGDEMIEYPIATEVYAPHDRFNGARVRARDGALAVGYADNLSYAANPVSLAESDVALARSVTVPTSGSSSGGCSISSTGNDPLLPLLALSASFWLIRRSWLTTTR